MSQIGHFTFPVLFMTNVLVTESAQGANIPGPCIISF